MHAALHDLPVDEDNDPFDGLSPEEIEARAEALLSADPLSELLMLAPPTRSSPPLSQEMIKREAPNGDPFEGMSPGLPARDARCAERTVLAAWAGRRRQSACRVILCC